MLCEIESFCCNKCSIQYKSYKSLWTHNKLKHDGAVSVKSVFIKKESLCVLYNCRSCKNVYKQNQTRLNHEKKCSGSNSQDKRIVALCKEKQNLELKIKLRTMKSEILPRNPQVSCVEISNTVIKDTNTESKMATNQIYLLREREFVTTDDNVYKIGRTNMMNCARMKNYPKGSQLISLNICINSVKFEYILIMLFKKKFIQMTEYGTEYFRGDVGEMKNEILKLLLDESNGYSSSSDNIASIQNIIDNNVAKHDVGRLPKERILELKELLNERITTLSNSRFNWCQTDI